MYHNCEKCRDGTLWGQWEAGRDGTLCGGSWRQVGTAPLCRPPRPNDKEKLEHYKAIIINEFFPKRGEEKMRFSVCRKAVSEFKSLDPLPEFLADLMLCIPECASEIADNYGDLWEQFYDATENNFEAAMKYINKHGLQSVFQKRIDQILHNCESSGWGFPDAMWDIYYDYSDKDDQ